MERMGILAAFAAALALGVPSAAGAATASSGTVAGLGYLVSYTAEAGEANQLTVLGGLPAVPTGAVTFLDAGARLPVQTSGCLPLVAGATCLAGVVPWGLAHVTLGDGNDQVTLRLGAIALATSVDGGTGNDTIDSVNGAVETILCGLGRDRVTADSGDFVGPDCEQVSRGSARQLGTTRSRSKTSRTASGSGWAVPAA